MCLLDPLAEAASECGRLKDSVRTLSQHSCDRNLSVADDRSEAPRTSLDVRHGTDCYRKLAVGETAPLGTGNQSKSVGATLIPSLKGRAATLGGQYDCSEMDR